MKQKIWNYSDLIIYFGLLLLLDFVVRIHYVNDQSLMQMYSPLPLFFTLGWCALFTWIAFLLRGRVRKTYMITTLIIFFILVIVHNSFYAQFSKFFSVHDLSLAKEGTEFMATSYIKINKMIIGTLILLLGYFAFLFVHHPQQQKRNKKIWISSLVAVIVLFACAQINVPSAKKAGEFDALNDPGVVYRDYASTTKALLMSGLYQYTFRDLFLAYNPIKNIDLAQDKKMIDDYFNSLPDTKPNNTHTGELKDKNLIMIQLENIDQWLITKEAMPNLYKLQQEGMDFTKHYSALFSVGSTFNTEFMVNTSYVTPINGSAPSQVYSENTYPYAFANVFKDNGYTANSFHQNAGSFYNREAAHKRFGYEAYHNYLDMHIEEKDIPMDSYLMNGYDEFISSDKFFSFIITISGHAPFTKDQLACDAHYDEMKPYDQYDNEAYTCGLAQAKETDIFIGKLLEQLTKDGNIDHTAIVLYADHYTYNALSAEMMKELKGTDNPNLVQNTPFIIWSKGIKSEKIDTITSSIDILPTVANLFDLDVNHKYFMGQDAFSKQDNGFVYFADGTLYNGEIYYDPLKDQALLATDKKLKEEVETGAKRTNISWKILLTDYFKDKQK